MHGGRGERRRLLDKGSPAAHDRPAGAQGLSRAASEPLLARHGIYLQPINHPTVPRGTERLRVTPTPLHDDGLVDDLVRALADTWRTLELGQVA